MDQFYMNVYKSIIYKWLVLSLSYYEKKGIDFHIDQNDPKKLVYHYDNLNGEIYFWDMHDIIEETIVDDKGKMIFYLHFRVMNLSNTRRFIIDFFRQLLSSQKPKHIGMSCSCGITTSLFTEKLQNLSNMMNLPYRFDVVPIDAIEQRYQDYDMIILAPQTSYLEPKIKAVCRSDCYIMSIDASIFATSNYQQALSIIQDKLS